MFGITTKRTQKIQESIERTDADWQRCVQYEEMMQNKAADITHWMKSFQVDSYQSVEEFIMKLERTLPNQSVPYPHTDEVLEDTRHTNCANSWYVLAEKVGEAKAQVVQTVKSNPQWREMLLRDHAEKLYGKPDAVVYESQQGLYNVKNIIREKYLQDLCHGVQVILYAPQTIGSEWYDAGLRVSKNFIMLPESKLAHQDRYLDAAILPRVLTSPELDMLEAVYSLENGVLLADALLASLALDSY